MGGFLTGEHEGGDDSSLPDAGGEQEEQADLAPQEDRQDEMRGLADGPDPQEEGEAEHAESAGSKVAEEEMAEVLPAETQRRAQAAAHAAIAAAAHLDHVHLSHVEPETQRDRDQQQEDEREHETKVIGGLDIFSSACLR